MQTIIYEEEFNEAMGWSLWNARGTSGIEITRIMKVWFGQKNSLDRTPFSWLCYRGHQWITLCFQGNILYASYS